MADFRVVSAVGRTLQGLLEQHFADSGDPGLATVDVFLESPRELRENGESVGVSLWLYRMTRNEHTLNHAPTRLGDDLFARAPFPANLHYLVTPFSTDVEDEQDLMGRVLQTFHDHAIIRGAALAGELAGTTEELRVNLETLSIEDLTRIWNALEEPYQLSVPYDVQVVAIDSAHEPTARVPVHSRRADYAQILATDAAS